jgi:hypothetical protein
MVDSFRNADGTLSPPSNSGTEFVRSIARTTDAEGDSPSGLKEKINEDISSMKDAAVGVAHKATDKASEMAQEQKGYAADQIGKLAGALERVGEELQNDDAGAIGGYAAQLGASARQFADNVKDKDFREIAAVAEDFGRRQPLAFLSLAAVAGLAASRFLVSSSPQSSASDARATSGSNSPSENSNV